MTVKFLLRLRKVEGDASWHYSVRPLPSKEFRGVTQRSFQNTIGLIPSFRVLSLSYLCRKPIQSRPYYEDMCDCGFGVGYFAMNTSKIIRRHTKFIR